MSGESHYGRYAALSDAEKVALGERVLQRFAGRAEWSTRLTTRLLWCAIYSACLPVLVFVFLDMHPPRWLAVLLCSMPGILLLAVEKLGKQLNRNFGLGREAWSGDDGLPRSEKEAERVLSAVAVPELFPDLVQANSYYTFSLSMSLDDAVARAASQITTDNMPEMTEAQLKDLARDLLRNHTALIPRNCYTPSAEYRIAIMRANRYLRSEAINASIKQLMRLRALKPPARRVRDVAREVGAELNL